MLHCIYTTQEYMCIAAMKSITAAMQGRAALRRLRITANVINLEANMTSGGCAYGLTFPCQRAREVRGAFDREGIAYGEFIGGNGKRF